MDCTGGNPGPRHPAPAPEPPDDTTPSNPGGDNTGGGNTGSGDTGGGNTGDPGHHTPEHTCASPWISNPQITSQSLFKPNYPVVVTQDPEGRGVDIQLAAQVSPAVYHFQRWQPIRWEDGCRKSDDASDVCEGKHGKKEARIPVEWGCVWHSISYPDTIIVFDSDYALDGGSIDWIKGPLQKRYPGAKVKGGPYPKLISWEKKQGLNTPSVRANVQKLGLVDPGKYWVALSVHTKGTPISDPVFKKFLYSFQVNLRDEAIIQ